MRLRAGSPAAAASVHAVRRSRFESCAPSGKCAQRPETGMESLPAPRREVKRAAPLAGAAARAPSVSAYLPRVMT